MNQQNDRPGTPATSQLPTHMRGKGIRTGYNLYSTSARGLSRSARVSKSKFEVLPTG
jgi:hypothetical protein